MPLSADKLRDAFRSFDADGSGSVSYGELFSATRLSATKAGADAAQTAAERDAACKGAARPSWSPVTNVVILIQKTQQQ